MLSTAFASAKRDLLLNGGDMDFYRAAQDAGFKVLGHDGVTVGTGSSALFPSPPAGTRMILFTVRTNTITVTGDGTTPTVGVAGVDYPAGSPYAIPINDSEAAGFKAIAASNTSVYVEYWGLP